MKNVLVVSSSDKGKEIFTDIVNAGGKTETASAANGSEARRILINQEFETIIINCPLSDEFGHELAVLIAENTTAGVVMVVKNEIADQVAAKVEDYGILVVAKPVSKPIFYQTLKFLEVSRKRILGLKKENIQLQTKIEEIRMIDRAKCVLIQQLQMTEPQAHRYIAKQAMDTRQTRREIAEAILRTYEF